MKPPKLRSMVTQGGDNGTDLFVPSPQDYVPNEYHYTDKEANGKTMFDMKTERELGFDKCGSSLERFAKAYELKHEGRLEESAGRIENFINQPKN